MRDFTELRVWQKAKELAVFIYNVTDKGKFLKDYGLRDQMRKAAVSIPSNIAEGEEYGTNKLIQSRSNFIEEPLPPYPET